MRFDGSSVSGNYHSPTNDVTDIKKIKKDEEEKVANNYTTNLLNHLGDILNGSMLVSPDSSGSGAFTANKEQGGTIA